MLNIAAARVQGVVSKPTVGHKLLNDLVDFLRLLALPAALAADHVGGDAVAGAGRVRPLAPHQAYLHDIIVGMKAHSKGRATTILCCFRPTIYIGASG